MTVSTIILAAGKGTRMKSRTPKILHKIAGKQLIAFSVGLAKAVKSKETIIVVGKDTERATRKALLGDKVNFCLQKNQLGTGDAVKIAFKNLKIRSKYTLILYGDTPFIAKGTIKRMISKADSGFDFVFLGFQSLTKNSYGKFKTGPKKTLIDIIEKNEPGYKTSESLSNSGILLARTNIAIDVVRKIKNDNAKQEYYLTDIVKMAAERGYLSTYVQCKEDECIGVNSQLELSVAERKFQDDFRKKLMASGVCMPSPETCFFSHDTVIKSGCIIEPNVVFGTGVEIRNSTIIKSHSYIEGTQIGKHCQIGPFVRLRPGTHLFDEVRIKPSTQSAIGGNRNQKYYLNRSFSGKHTSRCILNRTTEVLQKLCQGIGIRAHGCDCVLCFFELRCRYHFHGTSDLHGRRDRCDTTANFLEVCHALTYRFKIYNWLPHPMRLSSRYR